jgi:hypothetical protein
VRLIDADDENSIDLTMKRFIETRMLPWFFIFILQYCSIIYHLLFKLERAREDSDPGSRWIPAGVLATKLPLCVIIL